MKQRNKFAVLGIAITTFMGFCLWQINSDSEVAKLIAQLREPRNKVQCHGGAIPGGEILEFSPPMIDLIRIGGRARAMLHRHIHDPDIQNEVVLVLGSVGNSTTVSLLIDAYPQEDLKTTEWDWVNPLGKKEVCFTYALAYLTGQEIGRSRWGAKLDPKNRDQWQKWWKHQHWWYTVPTEKRNDTFMPQYPAVTLSAPASGAN